MPTDHYDIYVDGRLVERYAPEKFTGIVDPVGCKLNEWHHVVGLKRPEEEDTTWLADAKPT